MNLENRKLILISNAEPYAHKWEEEEIVCKKLPGGLTSALDPLMKNCHGTWIAWGRGNADFEVTEPGEAIEVPENGQGKENYYLKRIKLTEEEEEGFYYGFSNEIIWPISHSFIDRTILSDYSSSKEKWLVYRDVNRKYAEAALGEMDENGENLVWVHDYHMTLVPKMIKNEAPDAKISLFWHIPWPPWEMFGCLPWREEIMEGMLSSDFIGFHTPKIRDNFLSCSEKLGRQISHNPPRVGEGNQETRISSIPIGIDYPRYNSLSRKKKYQQDAEELRENFSADKIVLSVDRLDYTKGIPQRLRAFELFLEKYPEFQGEVTLVQRIPPSRDNVNEYQSTLEKINEIIGEINGKFEKVGWTPIKSFHRYLPKQEMLIPYYICADVALVTPLNDGMNLVCKEYVSCTDDGTLVLSEFAGASNDLTEAILVNPYDSDEVAQKLKKALTMPKEERKQRLEKLKTKVRKKDLNWWRNEFLKEWENYYDENLKIGGSC